uniref:RNA exonuclease 4 isoform X2 n=1 Tax=Nyctereutes procyonoides TaxID=34880 RepID=UPI00244485F2|nr:RNA exonuclease 4 isoform X2 [Nyctereutes procyonoides]
MAKALPSRRAPGDPQAEPGLGLKLPRKKSRKKRLWKSKRREAGEGAGGGRRVVVGRPPEAPEDFSRNWRALQELLKQKTQAPEKPLVSQTDSKKQPGITQQKRKAVLDKAQRSKVEMKTTDPGATGSDSLASGSPGKRKVPAPPTKASRAEHSEKGAKKRTNGDISPRGGDIKCGKWKWKAKEVPVALTPALPTNLTRALAMDCEMVGAGPKGEESVAARVSIVNQYGKCVYDKYVKPTQPVTDYRTAVSGIRPENLKQGEKFEVVQKEVADMLKGRILVGHALHNDLKVLFLDHPKKKIRDTQKYKPFKSQVKSGRPSLKLLAERILGIKVQQAEHCSIQDAQAAMRLYILVKKEWESTAQDKHPTAPTPDSSSVSVHRRL